MMAIPPHIHLEDSQKSPFIGSAGLSSQVQNQLRSTFMSPHLDIEPAMFDALTFKPACDDRAIVRYASSSGAVTAATPPRLVAEITSPSFLDYELLSDFFLTYRAFLDPLDLVRMLFARLRWALAKCDEVGMVVRVRTFVALRHWILNYFIDDFVCEYAMRSAFCNLLNDLISDVSHDSRGRRVQLKILAELKKCWRRVCAQFWDGPEFDSSLPAEAPIAPGGIAGHRDPGLDPDFWQKYLDNGPPQLDTIFGPLSSNPPYVEETSFYRDVAGAGREDAAGDRPGTPENQTSGEEQAREVQTSPASISSMDVVSCSFPNKSLKHANPVPGHPLAAHPVDARPVHSKTVPVATTPKALLGKRVRPQQPHKRNISSTDSLREHNTTLEKLLQKNTEALLSLPYEGSLVRGDLFPPGHAFVEVLSPSMGGASRQTTVLQPYPDESQKDKGLASAMSSQGMRKLIGSVRRALSTKGQDVSPTPGAFINISPIGPRGATTNRLPGTAIVPQARPQLVNGSRPPVRVDLLGAEIAEDFKRAVREDAAAEAAQRSLHGSIPSTPSVLMKLGEMAGYSAAHMDTTRQPQREDDSRRPFSDGALTTGSKSILIFDDTFADPTGLPIMTGALPVENASVETFSESFMHRGGDPTPPNTPPGQAVDTPRRSSYLPNHHVLRPVKSADALPGLVSGLRTVDPAPDARPSRDIIRPSMDAPRPPSYLIRQSLGLSSLGGERSQHTRHRSSRSFQSNGIRGSARRYTSFHSGIIPQPTIRSFDATTYSETASMDEVTEVPLTQPLRVLRRRPGGDLRKVTNVGDLDVPMTVRRSRSVGSLTTYSDSLRSSFIQSPGTVPESTGFVEVVNSDYTGERMDAFSLGVPTKKPHPLSLFSTHSSKPIMRPSFEAEAQKLAQIPDDADDDGGVESALAKLEGKFDKKTSKLPMEPTDAPLKTSANSSPVKEQDPHVKEEKKKHRVGHVEADGIIPPAPPAEDPLPDRSLAGSRASRLAVDSKPRYIVDDLGSMSNESYSSIPLLQRGMTDDGRRSKAEWTNRSVLQGPDEDGVTPDDERSEKTPLHPSYEIVKKSESMEKIKPGETMPATDGGPGRDSHQSFFIVDSDDDSDDDSALSSEMSDSPEEEANDPIERFQRVKPGVAVTTSGARIVASEPGPAPTMNAPSPPLTDTANIPELHDIQIWGSKPLPPTPHTGTPKIMHIAYQQRQTPDPTGVNAALRKASDTIDKETSKYSVHLPFILAFESETLAQQFTIIEKDAVNEIDWKELIDMRWRNAENGDCRSWVHFLRNADARGVEVVIARFNIMVKWAISEIVLTQDLDERARCVIKYIHIAMHCRRYRNFATMSQITLALTSSEVSHLTKTWRRVPEQDLRTLRDLEALVLPTRNFYNLRSEMEGGGITSADMGCIPFVGIYTHDLIFNAQRPSEIASSPATAPLVNFERCRIAASVIKTLLRLLEASTLYTFQPIEGITERCLWIGALTDAEIRRHSNLLE